ncbi:hypothetical protein ACR6C2_38380 [Streptomyces sp. INA 01156]
MGAEAMEPAEIPVGLAAVFLPAPLPRDGRIAFYDPRATPLSPSTPRVPPTPRIRGSRGSRGLHGADRPRPEPAPRARLTVTHPHGAGARRRTVGAHFLSLDQALPLLVRARHDPAAHPATACWAPPPCTRCGSPPAGCCPV